MAIKHANHYTKQASKALDYWLDDPGGGGVETLLHSFVSSLVLESILPPIK